MFGAMMIFLALVMIIVSIRSGEVSNRLTTVRVAESLALFGTMLWGVTTSRKTEPCIGALRDGLIAGFVTDPTGTRRRRLRYLLGLFMVLCGFAVVTGIQAEEERMYQILLHQTATARVAAYLQTLRNGGKAGARLSAVLVGVALDKLSVEAFLERLMATKQPQIFAESAVFGDGSDWNLTELGLLGDVSVAVPVRVFDNGRHVRPDVHAEPMPATLLFVAGALLANGQGKVPADWDSVTTDNQIDDEKYLRLYERRLLPVLLYAQEESIRKGTHAIVTIPGLGCGMFAGPFRGQLGKRFEKALEKIMEKHAVLFSHLRCVYYDPYDEGENRQVLIGKTLFRVRPLRRGNEARPQLCPPAAYAESGDDFSDCDLYSIVAWDHVSWPGNDFYGGSRATDDGVKGAATDVMTAMTGLLGAYDAGRTMYLPPTPYHTWGEVIAERKLGLQVIGRVRIFPKPE